MDVHLKQRLFIAIVILALVIIFVPMLFSKHEREKIATIQAIPSAPQKPQVRQVPISIPMEEDQEEHIQSAMTHPMPATQTQQHAAMTKTPSQPTKTVVSKPEQQPSQAVPPKSAASKEQPPAFVPKAEVQAPSKPSVHLNVVANSSSPVNGKHPVANTASHASPSTAQKQSLRHMVVRRAHILREGRIKHRKVIKDIPINRPLKVANLTLPPALPRHFHLRASHASSGNVMQHLTKQQKKQLAAAKKYEKAWVIQLGSFANTENADHLIKELRSKGLTAFGYKFEKHDKVFTRVYIGPTLKKDSAKKALKDVEHLVHMKGIVVPFNAAK